MKGVTMKQIQEATGSLMNLSMTRRLGGYDDEIQLVLCKKR